MLDLNRLRILRSVVATSSIIETADLLGFTPSTVSQHLKTLEREVGFPVLERVGRGIRATPAGVELARASGEVLHAMTELEARARDLRQGSTGRLTVSSFASAAYAWMPTVARSLRQEFPGLTIELSIIATEATDPAGIADIEVHSEFMQTPRPVSGGQVRVELGTDDFLIALPADHPLAHAGTADLASFATEDWVHYDFRDDMGTTIVGRACASAGFSPRYVARAEDHVTGLAFVAAGVGIAMVPELVLVGQSFGVAYVRPRNPVPQRRIVAMVRDSARTSPPVARALTLLSGFGRHLSGTRLDRP